MLPVLLSVITRALITSDNCFGGIETFEKLSTTNFEPNTVPMAGVLLQQDNVALTRDCINLCKQQQRCTTFFIDYQQFQCLAYVESSKRHRDHLQIVKNTNLFEKICLKGISRQEFEHICGNERLWSFERVKDTFLDGYIEKELTNVADREECAKACLIEIQFICRSADFDEVKRICRLSKENRRTQPQAFVYVKDSQRDYIENQCAPSGPASCVYTTKMNTNVFSMDSLQFASSIEDCQLQCDREQSFNCRSYGFINNRCMLSGDDEKTIGKHPLTTMKGAMYGERTCVAELCTNGIFTYEKITGHVLRSAITTPVELPQYSSLGVTSWCRASCDMAQLNCPAFTINYKNNRCERLDRNTQGRITDLTVADGESFFEKICLRVPQIMSQCQDKFWAFERVLGYELAPVLYRKTLNFVQSRRDCQEYCLQEREFPCRSALYNDETTECKLSSEDRRTSPGHYYRSRNMKINYLENQCVRIHSSCPYQRTTNAYPTYTDIVETDNIISNEECEKLCNDNRYFLCRSYAFYSSNSQCFLSGDDSVSAGSSFIQHRGNIIYYERQCSKLSTFNNQSNNINNNINDNNVHMIDTTTDDYPIPLTPLTDRIGETSTLSPGSILTQTPPPTSSLLTSSPSLSPDIDPNNINKEVVIINGTVGGIITTKITRFPESLLPTISPIRTSSPRSMGYPGMDSNLNNNNNNNNNQAQPSYDHTENYDSMNTRYPSINYSSNKKCAPNARFLFEKVTSFEPIGGHLTLLYTDLQNPGIVTECARRCEHSSLCRAFVIDYFHQTCHGLFENSSVGLLDLRLSMGKDYFEGFCVPNFVHCDKFWPFDRIIDQAVIGARPEDIVRFVTRPECRTRCLEEKKFRCSSASYNSFTHECHLYSDTRDSGSLTLQFSKGIDFMENQCVIDVKSCRYHSIERDISIVSVTKSVRGTSTFHCEQACDYEKEFNCRSYTYLDNPDGSLTPGGNLCLLSADNRATSHQGSIQFRPRALYAEKDCLYQKNFRTNPSYDQQNNFNQHQHSEPTSLIGPINYASESEGLTGRRIDPTTPKPDYVSNVDMINQNITPDINVNLRPTFDNMVQLQHIPHRCSSDEYTFEKTFGYDLRYAQREKAPIVSRPGVVKYCKDECIRRGDRCMAFIIEYGSDKNQNCYFLSESASENRNQLNKMIGTTYNEKICLREKTCDNIWTFERIIGYTMDETADREINSIMFRTACQDLCLLEKSFSCRSLTYDYGRRICRLFRNTRRSKPQSFQKTFDHIDYFENKCIKELSTCQYRGFNDRHTNYIDKLSIATTLIDCQKQCDSEYSFHCKSINYNSITQECSLSSEDSLSMYNIDNNVNVDDNVAADSSSTLITEYQSSSIYSEKGTCEQVSVQCNQEDMVLILNFDSPFMGRVYTKNNPSKCFINGSGQLQLQFAIPLDSRCGTHQESTSSYVNEVIVQQHSIILTDNDRTIRVLCSFEISDQTITLGNIDQQQQQQHQLPLNQFPQQKNIPILNGIDVSTTLNGRSYSDRKSSATVVTNTAAPPSIQMRILDPNGKDAQVVSLGDDLVLKIELKNQNHSPYAIFARNLYARSSNGESLYLIDNNGCPIDSSIFPALQLDTIDHRSLQSKFKAFRFPSTGVVNFEVQIRFCQEYCEPVKCTQLNGHIDSFGRRRRRRRSVNNFQELFLHHHQPSINWQTNRINMNKSDNITKQFNYLSTENLTRINSSNNFYHEILNIDQINQSSSLNNFNEFTRNKIVRGFTYPTDNYHHYRNPNNNNNNHSIINQNLNEFDETIFTKTFKNISNNNNNIDNKNMDLLSSTETTTIESFSSLESNSNDNQTIKEMFENKITTTTTEAIIEETLNIIPVNAALPLPTTNVATEIPLSLAIMVDNNNNNDNDNNDNNDNDAINSNNEDNEIENPDLVDDKNDDNYNNHNNHQYQQWIKNRKKNYKYMSAAIRNVQHHLENHHQNLINSIKNDKKLRKTINDDNLHLVCTDYCTNTGIIIFITTLIVSIIHLTLGISIYLYLTRLKQSSNELGGIDNFYNNHRQNIKKRNLMFIRNVIGAAPSNYHLSETIINDFNNCLSKSQLSSTPSSSSSSSSSSFYNDNNNNQNIDSISINDDILTPNIINNNNNNDEYEENKIKQQQQTWFGIDEQYDEQNDQKQQNFGSIRSKFNNDDVYFSGPREQRFFGINNYQFNNTVNHHRSSYYYGQINLLLKFHFN